MNFEIKFLHHQTLLSLSLNRDVNKSCILNAETFKSRFQSWTGTFQEQCANIVKLHEAAPSADGSPTQTAQKIKLSWDGMKMLA